jgi:hypothetical protein
MKRLDATDDTLARLLQRLVRTVVSPEDRLSLAAGPRGAAGREALKSLRRLVETPIDATWPEDEMGKRILALSSTQLQELRTLVRDSIATLLDSRDEAEAPHLPTIHIEALAFTPSVSRRGLVTILRGTPADVIAYRLVRLLQRVGVDRLRRCAADDCRAVFVRFGRSKFHSRQCEGRANMRRYRQEGRV